MLALPNLKKLVKTVTKSQKLQNFFMILHTFILYHNTLRPSRQSGLTYLNLFEVMPVCPANIQLKDVESKENY